MKLLIVWNSNNDHDIEYFIKPYAINSKKHNWFDDVEVLIWGKSTDKVKESALMVETINAMVETGITVNACKYCADQLSASHVLEDLGVIVDYTGVYLTEKLKDPEFKVITI